MAQEREGRVIESENRWAALAPEGFLRETLREVEWKKLKILEQHGDLLVFEGECQPLAWARVNWKKVFVEDITSINDAARRLRPLARKWAHASTANHRRGELILEQLRAYRRPATVFPELVTEEGVGVFTLTGASRLLYCLDYDRPDPEGIIEFAEDKTAPSRAYLKLWEALVLLGARPKAGDTAVDLGACPGGWTYVVASLHANVLAVDRSPLSPAVAAMPGVEFRAGDAFQVLPHNSPEYDWLLSDVICYPEKLLELVEAWVVSGKVGHFVCTIKFQGEPDPAVIEKFRAHGRVLHLHYNKHELTFLR